MLEKMPDLPDHVLGFSASGTVTARDYESVLIPAVDAISARHGKVRMLYRLGPEFKGFEMGAMWDDAKVGLRHRSEWERVALVTDIDWLRAGVKLLRFAIPGQIRLFHDADLDEARRWLIE